MDNISESQSQDLAISDFDDVDSANQTTWETLIGPLEEKKNHPLAQKYWKK